MGVPAMSPAIREQYSAVVNSLVPTRISPVAKLTTASLSAALLGSTALQMAASLLLRPAIQAAMARGLGLRAVGGPHQIVKGLGGQPRQGVGQRLRRCGQHVDQHLPGRIHIPRKGPLDIRLVVCPQGGRDLAGVGVGVAAVLLGVLDDEGHHPLLRALYGARPLWI